MQRTASSDDAVRDMYRESVGSYGEIMDGEIDLPMYAERLERLARHLEGMEGPVVDTSCGTGHMLQRYGERYDRARALVGIDLSEEMVAASRERLGEHATVFVGDMRTLEAVQPQSAAALISFFALHHLDAAALPGVFAVWAQLLRPGGRLLLATWEGEGAIDYGEHADIVAFMHPAGFVADAVRNAGLVIDLCQSEAFEEMGMNAVFVEATRA